MANTTRRPFTRREFLKATAGSFATASLLGHVGISAGRAKSVPVGVQLFCFRHLLEKDFEGTIAKVATLGYDGVEFAGYYDYSATDLKKLLDKHELQCAGAHVGLDSLMGDALQESIDFHGELGNSNLIVAAISEDRRTSKDVVLRTAEEFTAIQEQLTPHGMRTGYHCHAYSFNTPHDGETIWDLLADNTPDDLILQLDTGNAAHGGANLVDVLNGHPDRIASMHVKPYTTGAEEPFAPFIGDDSLPWEDIFTLSESVGGIEWYVVEYEDESHPPLEALKANRERVAGFGR